MTNQLTRVIMQNIVDKCTTYKRKNTCKMHIGNKEVNMIRNIIHKDSSVGFKSEVNTKIQSKDLAKYITLDELISKSIGDDKVENRSSNGEIKDSYVKRINKISLEEIVPKVSLTSIGKKG